MNETNEDTHVSPLIESLRADIIDDAENKRSEIQHPLRLKRGEICGFTNENMALALVADPSNLLVWFIKMTIGFQVQCLVKVIEHKIKSH
jgi:hypothetical protein